MILYLVRHADAGDPSAWSGDDADRPLTPLGHRQAITLGESLKARGVTVGSIVTSPLVRAWETAAELRDVLLPDGPEPEHCPLLAPEVGKRRKLCRFLEGVGAESVVAVGHAPDIGDLAAWLIGADGGAIEMEKGAAVAIEFDEEPGKGDGQLLWAVNPLWFLPPEQG